MLIIDEQEAMPFYLLMLFLNIFNQIDCLPFTQVKDAVLKNLHVIMEIVFKPIGAVITDMIVLIGPMKENVVSII